VCADDATTRARDVLVILHISVHTALQGFLVDLMVSVRDTALMVTPPMPLQEHVIPVKIPVKRALELVWSSVHLVLVVCA